MFIIFFVGGNSFFLCGKRRLKLCPCFSVDNIYLCLYSFEYFIYVIFFVGLCFRVVVLRETKFYTTLIKNKYSSRIKTIGIQSMLNFETKWMFLDDFRMRFSFFLLRNDFNTNNETGFETTWNESGRTWSKVRAKIAWNENYVRHKDGMIEWRLIIWSLEQQN